jgi:Brp/Blh family beta-carotene 15,15'-monooxygenase
MRTAVPAAGLATGFAGVAFRGVPLACLAAAAVGGCAGAGWSERLAPVPWLVALVCVGLPHGAADFAISRRAWRGRPLVALWLAYAAAIALVAAGFVAAPVTVITLFALVSCWHFGAAHLAADGQLADGPLGVAAVIARGGIVLAAPLAVWPAETATAAADLVQLAAPRGPGPDPLLAPSVVRAAGLVLAGLTASAVGVEAWLASGRPACRRRLAVLLVDLVVIGGLGLGTHPLFAVGLYFLVWHSWRQMEPLAETLTGAVPRSWPALVRAVAWIHAAALPLLVPTWAAIAAAWWHWSPTHAPRDLALLSIGGYLLVTPAHEWLGHLLAAAKTGRAATATSPPWEQAAWRRR